MDFSKDMTAKTVKLETLGPGDYFTIKRNPLVWMVCYDTDVPAGYTRTVTAGSCFTYETPNTLEVIPCDENRIFQDSAEVPLRSLEYGAEFRIPGEEGVYIKARSYVFNVAMGETMVICKDQKYYVTSLLSDAKVIPA